MKRKTLELVRHLSNPAIPYTGRATVLIGIKTPFKMTIDPVTQNLKVEVLQLEISPPYFSPSKRHYCPAKIRHTFRFKRSFMGGGHSKGLASFTHTEYFKRFDTIGLAVTTLESLSKKDTIQIIKF